jgi:hypothetical protein
MFYHHIYFKYIIIIFIFSQFLYILNVRRGNRKMIITEGVYEEAGA